MRGCSPDVASRRRIHRSVRRAVRHLRGLSRAAPAVSPGDRALDARAGGDLGPRRARGGARRPDRALAHRAARSGRLRSGPRRERRARARAFRMSSLSAIRDGRLADRRVLDDGRLARALQALDGQGEETRLVGGAVRDLALGEKAGDFDLATTALPALVMRRARAAGFGVAPTGLAHGTGTVGGDSLPIEVTTLRQDVATDGRRAKVAFGR